ncbi:MAG: thiamine phosphate synthase [Deltaproteobacteria bacterium]|nr:thiamine phosphate synthase [Deltaproteobacteria bacterium]
MTFRARGLYAIVDLDAFRARGVDPARPGGVESICEALISGGAAVLQLRAKHEGGRDTLSLLRRMAPVARAGGVPLFANDRADLAVLAGVEGVHVGQDDLAIDDVRRVSRALLVGVSTHDPKQLAAAIAAAPDYLAYGPVFGTTSKERPDATVGVAGLSRAVSLAAGRPLVGIGGIGRANVAAVRAAGASLVAVISDLCAVSGDAPDLPEIERRAGQLVEALA